MDIPECPFDVIAQALQSKSFASAPEPFGVRKCFDDIACLDIAILKQTNGKVCAVKILDLKDKGGMSHVLRQAT